MQRSPLNTTFDFQTVRTATSPHATKQRYRRAPHKRGAHNAHTHLHPRAVSSHRLRGAEARPVIREAGCGKSALCCRYPTKAEVFPLAWDRWLSLRHQAVRTMLDRAIARGSGYAKDGPAEVRHAQSYPLFLADSPLLSPSRAPAKVIGNERSPDEKLLLIRAFLSPLSHSVQINTKQGSAPSRSARFCGVLGIGQPRLRRRNLAANGRGSRLSSARTW